MKMLPFALRRLGRKKQLEGLLKVKEFSRVVGQEWLELKQKGEETFMSEIDEEQVEKQKKCQRMRQVFIWHKMKQGEASLRDSFNLWKENTVLKSNVARNQAVVQRFKDETEMEKKISEELQDEIDQINFEMNQNDKEFKREQVWYETKLKKVTLDSNTSKARGKAIELCMNVIMDRHKQRLMLRSFHRMH